MHPDFDLDTWRVRPSLNLVERGDERRRLGPKAMDALVLLASRGGEVVSRDELVAEVWHGAAVSDEAVATAIWELRRALDDDARRPRFVATVRGRGYRLVAPPAGLATGPSRPRRRAVTVGALAAAGLAGALLALALQPRPPAPPADPAPASPAGSAAPGPVTSAVRVLAVQPLDPVDDADGRGADFAAGLGDMLRVDLALSGAFDVIDVERAGGPLVPAAADAVVEGSVQLSAGRVWITVQLVDLRSGRLLWGGNYERSLDEHLGDGPAAARRRMALDIARQIRERLVDPGP